MERLAAPSPNFGPRRGYVAPDMVLLHYTGMTNGAEALARLRDPACEVSAHYMIEEDGRVFHLVDEMDRAWHAGAGRWGETRDVNSASIGIELVNPGHEWGYRAFPEAQMVALEALLEEILARWSIDPARVIGHSDIAPERKDDPGELFDWRRLAAKGLAVWPAPQGAADRAPVAPEAFLEAAARVGYPVEAGFEAVLTAFRRRFAPGSLGRPLCADDIAMLESLASATP